MPSMFPVSHNSDPGDANRRINYWQPGDGIPGTVKFAFVLLLLSAMTLLYSGFMMWTVERPVVDDADQMDHINTVSTNLKWVGTVQIIGAVLIALLMPSLLRGDGRRRRWLMTVIALTMAFTLVGWVFRLGGLEQALIALALACAALAMFRPALRTYFGGSPGELEQ